MHQWLARRKDEPGSRVGVVTLQNVLEQIVGAVEDECNDEPPSIAEDGEIVFMWWRSFC